MRREDELAAVREQVSILAGQVARLMEIISAGSDSGRDTTTAEEKLAVLEALMWKLHLRHRRLKTQAAIANSAVLLSPGWNA